MSLKVTSATADTSGISGHFPGPCMAAKAQALGKLNWAPRQRELRLLFRWTLSKGFCGWRKGSRRGKFGDQAGTHMKRTAPHSQGADDEPATRCAKPTPPTLSPWADARAFGSNSWWAREKTEKTEKAETGSQYVLCHFHLHLVQAE